MILVDFLNWNKVSYFELYLKNKNKRSDSDSEWTAVSNKNALAKGCDWWEAAVPFEKGNIRCLEIGTCENPSSNGA